MTPESLINRGRFGVLAADRKGVVITACDAFKAMFCSENGEEQILSEGTGLYELLGYEGDADLIANMDSLSSGFLDRFGLFLADYFAAGSDEPLVLRFIPQLPGPPDPLRFAEEGNLVYIETDADYNIVYASSRAEEVTGKSRHELMEMNASHFIVLPHSLAEKAEKTSVSVQVIPGSFADSSWSRERECTLFPFVKEGKVSGFSVLFREPLSGSVSAESSGMNLMLSAAGIFAGAVAHDYNNSLTVVLGNLSLAKLEAPENSELMDVLEDAENASLQIKRQTEKLSAFVKGFRPEKVRTGLKKVIEDAVALLKDSGSDRIIISPEIDDTEIELDPALMSRVFAEIFRNSLEATGPGDSDIQVSSERMSVEEETPVRDLVLVPGEYEVITVQDRGCGMDEETVKRIFDPNYTTKQGRTGMGLAYVYAVLRRHRGFADVSSSPGNGSRFRIYLPLF